MYCEDDILITEANFDAYVDIQNKLPLPYVCGFLRYENKVGSDQKWLIDNHPSSSCLRFGKTVIKDNYILNGEDYFEVYNFHQGCYVLTKKLMNYVIDGGFYRTFNDHYAGRELKGAASNVFMKGGITKVIPRKRVGELLIHHLPNKYMSTDPNFTDDIVPTEKQIALMQPRYVDYKHE